MRVAVCATGTSGDHRPLMAIALELRRRGHEVDCIVHPQYASDAKLLGIPVHVAGAEWREPELASHPELLDPRSGFFAIMRDLLLPDACAQFHCLEAMKATRKIDLIVAHHLALGAVWWAESRRVRLVISWLSPAVLLRPDGRGTMIPGVARATPKLIASVFRHAIPFIFRRELDAAANTARASLGLTPDRDAVLRLLTSSHGHIALWDEAFRPPLAGDPPELVTCGFPFLECDGADSKLPGEIAEYLEDGLEPIVCALGTTAGTIPVQLSDVVTEACELVGRRALVIGDRPPVRARTSRWLAYAPHARAFEKSGLVLHHAGIGTLAEVLRAGKVSLALPLANDQFDNAVRLKGLGVTAILNPRTVTAPPLADAIRRLLEDHAAAGEADRLGARVRASNGASRAADAVLGSS